MAEDIGMGQINLGPEREREGETDPIMDEIEDLFEKLKESDILLSNMVEHNEMVCSNLVMAHYLAKLEKTISTYYLPKSGDHGRFMRWLRRKWRL